MAKKKNPRALVADDSATMRRITVERLQGMGWQVVEVPDGERALRQLERGDFDLLITDWNMPVMSGLELVEEMRGRKEMAELLVLMMSTRNTGVDVARAVVAGVDDYFTKPYTPDLLRRKIERIMGREGLGALARELVAKRADADADDVAASWSDGVLSQSEIDVLLYGDGLESMDQSMQAAMETKEDQGQSQQAKAPIIATYDFKHPARVNKDQLRTLENLHDNFARLMSSTFSGAMRAVVDVDTAFVDQTTYREFIMSLSNPSCSYQFTLGPTNGQVIIDVPLPLVFAFVDRIFGGKGSSRGVDGRQITPIEIGVINRVIKRVIEDLEATWEPILPVEIYDIELETNPEFMQITAASEIVVLMAFEVNSTNASGLVSVCYPFFTLEPILPRLSQPAYVTQGRPDREERRLSNRLLLSEMGVPLVAELGRTRIKLGEAEALREGDVIRLPTREQDPVTVHLGGKPKLLARPFAKKKGGDLKLKVVGEVPVDYQARLGSVEVYPASAEQPAEVHGPQRE